MEVIGEGGNGNYLCQFLSYNRPVVSYAFSRYRYALEEYTVTPV